MPEMIARRYYRYYRYYRAKQNKLNCYLLAILLVCFILKYLTCKDPEYVPSHLQKYLLFDEQYKCSNGMALLDLYEKVEQLNSLQEVQNGQQLGPVHGDTPVLVVRAACDPERLQYLILSLAQVNNIKSALVVFSHSFYDERVHQLIKSITFCMILQIYFPNSVQLYPNVFPGVDLNYCDNSTQKESEFACVDRIAHLSETKHHWWWTAHSLFERMPWAHTHTGMVMFLEESNYVLPDLLHMLRFAQSSLAYVPEAQLLAFGRNLAGGLDRDKLTVDSWRPPYDKGLAFNRTAWKTIKALSKEFCEYDDVSWSYSLRHAFESLPHHPPVMVACMAPRVISTALFRSGRHALENIYELTRSRELFPAKVKTVVLYGDNGKILRNWDKPPRGNGGWSDQRDQLLCMSPLASTGIPADFTTKPPVFS